MGQSKSTFFKLLPTLERETIMVKKLRQTIKDITDATLALTRKYEKVNKIKWKISEQLDSFRFFLYANSKLSEICQEAI